MTEAKYSVESRKSIRSGSCKSDDATRRRVQSRDQKAFQVLGCEGLARIDTSRHPDGAVYVNGPNTARIYPQPRFHYVAGQWHDVRPDCELIELALERPPGLR